MWALSTPNPYDGPECLHNLLHICILRQERSKCKDTHTCTDTHTNGEGLCQGCHQTSNSQLGKDIAKVVIKTSSSQLGKDIAKDVIKYPVVSWWDIQ